jgi:hypothetical protein
MNINRDNYEEYFLLYADNELSEQEKNAVEVFVKQHPDLEEELVIIKLSVSKPDDDSMLEDKNFLFKETSKFINHANYEEIFVLYNDNELKGNERQEAESFLLKNSSLKNEFELLQRTKLPPDDTIVFDNKKLLYREEDAGKIILFKWWRVAVAAVLLGIGIWSGIAYLQNSNKELPDTAENNTVKKVDKISPAPFDTKPIEPVNVIVEKEETKTQKQKLVVKKNTSKQSLKKSIFLNGLPQEKNQAQANNLPADMITKNIENVQPKLRTETKIDPVRENIHTENSVNKVSQEDGLANANRDAETKAISTSFAFDENENNNNYAFYNIPQEKFNRSKLGGFLRKVKRIIERKISPLNNTKDKTEIAVN